MKQIKPTFLEGEILIKVGWGTFECNEKGVGCMLWGMVLLSFKHWPLIHLTALISVMGKIDKFSPNV